MQTSALLANICLTVATLTFMILVKEIYLKPMPGGDYGVGYAWGALIFNFVFILSIGLSMACIGWRGGFQWMTASGGNRIGLVLLCFVAIAISMGVIGMGEGRGILRKASQVLSMALPLAILTTGFLLANDKLEGGVPSLIARWMSKLVFGTSGVYACAFLLTLLIPKLQRSYASLTYDHSQLDSFQEGILVNIDTCNIEKDMVFILVHTDEQRHPTIRARALAKIKSRPDWQEELVRRLDSGWVEEAFTFLASNEVDNKALFPEAVRLGILNLAKIVRQTIKDKRELKDWRFSEEVDHALRTVDKFEGMGVDYRPAVQELRAAFGQASPYDQLEFRAARMLDKWLKKH